MEFRPVAGFEKVKREPVSPQKLGLEDLAGPRKDVHEKVREWMQKCVDPPYSTDEEEEEIEIADDSTSNSEHHLDYLVLLAEVTEELRAKERKKGTEIADNSTIEKNLEYSPKTTGKLQAKQREEDEEKLEESSEVSSDSDGVNNNFAEETKPPCAGCKFCGGGNNESDELDIKTGVEVDNTRESLPFGSPRKISKHVESPRRMSNGNQNNCNVARNWEFDKKSELSDDYVQLAAAPTRKDAATGMGSSQEGSVTRIESEEDSKGSDTCDSDNKSISDNENKRQKKNKPQRRKNRKRYREENKPRKRMTRSMAHKKSLDSDEDDSHDRFTVTSEPKSSGSETPVDEEDDIDEFIVSDESEEDEESNDIKASESETSSEENEPKNNKSRRNRNLRSSRKKRSCSNEPEIKTLRSRKIRLKKKIDSRNGESEDYSDTKPEVENENSHDDDEESERSSSAPAPRIRTRAYRNRTASRIKRRASQVSFSSEDGTCEPAKKPKKKPPLSRKKMSAYKNESQTECSSSSPTKTGLKSSMKSNLNQSRTRSGTVLRRSSTKQVTFDPTSAAQNTRKRKRIRDPSLSSSSESSDIFIQVVRPQAQENIEPIERNPVDIVSSASCKSEDSDDSAGRKSSLQTPEKSKGKLTPPKKRRKEATKSSDSSNRNSEADNSSSDEDEKAYQSPFRSRWRRPRRSPSPYRESPSPQDKSEALVREIKSFVDTTGVGIRRRNRRFSGNKFVQDGPEKESGSDESSDSFVDQSGEVGGLLESSDSSDTSGEAEPEDNLDLNSDNFESGNSEDENDDEIGEDSGPDKSQSESEDDQDEYLSKPRLSQNLVNSVLETCTLCKNLGGSSQVVDRDEYPTSEKWCKCGCCKVVSPKMRDYDRICCQDFKTIRKLLSHDGSDDEESSCITNYKGFQDFLDYKSFLRAVKTKKRQVEGLSSVWAAEELEKFKKAIDEIKINMCGDSFNRWIFGKLHKRDRVPLPACVMKNFRKQYAPNSGPNYFTPFKPGLVCASAIRRGDEKGHCRKAKVALT